MTEEIIFLPETYDESIKAMHAKGTLNEWNTEVLGQVKGQPWPIFCLCFAFVGPLLKPAHTDCFGVHLYGETSQGKTTAGQLACSVWGRGTDPATDKASYMCRWNHTSNNLSAVCAAHNDCLLVMDEFGTCPKHDAHRFVYDIFGGQEKGRLDRNSNQRARRTWRVAVFSTGEISVAQRIAEGGETHGGHLVRFLDIPIGKNQLFVAEDTRKLVNDLKLSCGMYYGTAGRQFLQALTQKYKNMQEIEDLVAQLRTLAEPAYHALLPSSAATAYSRVMDRFTLIEIAGQLACDFLEWKTITREDIAAAVQHVCKIWLSANNLLTDSARGLVGLRNFILSNEQKRFVRTGLDDKKPPLGDIVGYIDQVAYDETCYLFETDLFRDVVCKEIGTQHRILLRELDAVGMLKKDQVGRKTHKYSAPNGRREFYAIRQLFLTDRDEANASS